MPLNYQIQESFIQTLHISHISRKFTLEDVKSMSHFKGKPILQ